MKKILTSLGLVVALALPQIVSANDTHEHNKKEEMKSDVKNTNEEIKIVIDKNKEKEFEGKKDVQIIIDENQKEQK